MTPAMADFVTPICAFTEIDANLSRLDKFMGTAFYIDSRGTFLTARHVIEKCAQQYAASGQRFGVVVRYSRTQTAEIIDLPEIEHAPASWDISIGKIERPTTKLFSWPQYGDLNGLDDVMAYGFPESATVNDDDGLVIHMRALKGYVTRPLRENYDRALVGNTPPSYELDFAVPQGMSGSPLLVRDLANQRLQLYGICVGSRSSSVTEYQRSEVESNGRVYREVVLRAQEYGIAHSIFGLHDWRPGVLGGRTLCETLR